MTDFHNIPSDPTEPPPGAAEGFLFKPAGTDVWQVFQKLDGEYLSVEEALARIEEGKKSK
jgi:hypothetical protein